MGARVGQVVCEECGRDLAVSGGPPIGSVDSNRRIIRLEVEKCGCGPGGIRIGDRVRVKPEHDEALRMIDVRTPPRVVDEVHPSGIVSVLEEGQAVPYHPHELERV